MTYTEHVYLFFDQIHRKYRSKLIYTNIRPTRKLVQLKHDCKQLLHVRRKRNWKCFDHQRLIALNQIDNLEIPFGLPAEYPATLVHLIHMCREALEIEA